MAEETKITLKMGLIASGVAALVVMMVAAMWNYHGRITILETNYTHVSSTLSDIKETLKDIRADQIRREKQERR
jgi:CRISPR/Cas system-associated endonuclease Cas3-HD